MMVLNAKHIPVPEPPSPFRVVVVAASAGGIQALTEILSHLPPDFSLPIAVMQHRRSRRVELLTKVLGRATELPVKIATVGEHLESGTVYVAPPDRHLLLTPDGALALHDGRRIPHVLSSANPLFESAADTFGPGVIAVVLTGGDADGSEGVLAVKAHGGVVIAQDAATSQVFDMPQAAVNTGSVDYVLPLGVIGPMLVALATGKLTPKTAGYTA